MHADTGVRRGSCLVAREQGSGGSTQAHILYTHAVCVLWKYTTPQQSHSPSAFGLEKGHRRNAYSFPLPSSAPAPSPPHPCEGRHSLRFAQQRPFFACGDMCSRPCSMQGRFTPRINSELSPGSIHCHSA